MGHSSPPNEPEMGPLDAQLREAYGRVAYAHKAHEKDADRYFARGRYFKTAQIILSAVTTGGLLAVLFGKSSTAAIVSTVTATAQLILSTYSKEINLGELAQKHAETAARLWLIREKFLSLISDLRAGASHADLRRNRDELQRDLAAVYAAAPRTSPIAYARAQKALQVNEELTFSDSEIDRLLPPGLRRR